MSKLTETIGYLEKNRKDAEEKYREQLSRETPPLWMLWVVPVLGAITSTVVCRSYLPKIVLLPNRNFSTAHFDLMTFFFLFFLILNTRKRNGANYNSLNKARKEVERTENSIEKLLFRGATAEFSKIQAEITQVQAELAQSQAELAQARSENVIVSSNLREMMEITRSLIDSRSPCEN